MNALLQGLEYGIDVSDLADASLTSEQIKDAVSHRFLLAAKLSGHSGFAAYNGTSKLNR